MIRSLSGLDLALCLAFSLALPAGQVREYQVRIKVRFRMRNSQGRDLIEPTDILQERDISFNESAVLAKEAEEVLLYRDMQSDIVQQLLRRIAAVKSLNP